MNTGSKILKDILCSQKSPSDRSSFSYDQGASTSMSKDKIVFVSRDAHGTPHIAQINNVLSSSKKKNVLRIVHTSAPHQCGIKRHISLPLQEAAKSIKD